MVGIFSNKICFLVNFLFCFSSAYSWLTTLCSFCCKVNRLYTYNNQHILHYFSTWVITNYKMFINKDVYIFKRHNACTWIDYWMKAKVTQSCLTLYDPTGYTVHGILQARIQEWVAVPFSRRSSQPRDPTQVSCTAGGFFTSWATRDVNLIFICTGKPKFVWLTLLQYSLYFSGLEPNLRYPLHVPILLDGQVTLKRLI